MSTLGDNVDEAAVGPDGRVRRPRSRSGWTRAVLVTVLATGAVLLGAPTASAATATADGPPAGTATAPGAPASVGTAAATTGTVAVRTAADPSDGDAARAQQTSPPTPSPQVGTLPPGTGSPSPAPSDRPAVRPSISDPGDVTTGTVRFHGLGTPGHLVRVTGPTTTGSAGCSATVGADGSWACIATVRSGPQQVFTVSDRSDPALGSSSAPASDVVVPPVVTTDRPTPGPVSGSGLPGATVSLTVVGSSTVHTTTVGPDGRWTVSLSGDGARDGSVTVSAAQTASTTGGYRSDLRSAPSAPRPVVLDRTAPAAPVVGSPGRGEQVRAQPFTVRGTGEPGAVVTVYLDRSPVCRSEVGADGRWACTTSGTAAAGARTVSAMQQDAAGNASRSSAAVRVVLSGATASATGGATNGTTAAPGATAPAGPGAPATPGGTGSSAGSGGPGADGSTAGGSGDTGGAAGAGGSGTGGGGRGLPDWSGPAGDWTAGTAFDHGVPTIQASFSWSTVLLATGVAAGFLVLVAAPLALFGAAVHGRLRNPVTALLGRNRSRAERRLGDDVLPTWAAAAIGVGIVGTTTVLGVGVALEARYVRLGIAVLLGAAVTTAAVVLAVRWAAGADHRAIGFRVSPWLVLAALVACVLTRTGDLSPALVVGSVLVPVGRPGADTAALRLASSAATGVRSATARSVALLVVAATGWALHSVVHGAGFWSTLVAEFAAALCIGAVGALVATLLPVPGSAGAVLVAGARGRYVGLTVGAVALAAIVAGGRAPVAPSPAELGVATGLCVLAAGCCWAWLRRPRPRVSATRP
ncbi:Ig-like domain-containing protein [Curtobacterium sp. MCSS17_007]|uniref:Ig-like domain-containing protein n=1 Tax=Curtobacterium sp. MCSS17_007 TaxID=2175646 RepID=UPI0011B5516B|nr:Ig-like domain-containing protein [Curtobacterium sp. MCSS17_007]WIE76354.1 Ig-like domain-containing protein [Curtobacterium sp. MCSS17_007]